MRAILGGRFCGSVALAWALLGGVRLQAADAPAVVALLVDTSGSLTKADLARTRALAAGLLAELPSGSEVAVYTFDDQPHLILPRSSSPDDVRHALEIAGIAGRFTALNDALYDASRYLRDAPPGRKAIVLVTDGKDENSALNLDDALKVAQEVPIPVFAVGVGRAEERVLRRIAKLTQGEYFPAREATGSALAGRIMAVAESTPSPSPAPLVKATPATKPGAPAETPEAGLGGLWLAVIVGAVALLALVGLALRRRSRPRCATCGRELASPLTACAFCQADAGSPTLLERRGSAADDDVSPTVMARMDLTEEYLEKTVTLQDQPVLTITSGPGSGMVFSLNRSSATSLGRAKANDIVLEDVSISGQHCRIRPEAGRFVLHDLKSTNGTFVNERRVTSQPLAEGDVLKVGETYLQFRMNQRKG